MLYQKQTPMKVILLGSSGVGKTSILNKYVKNIFQDNLKPTIGVDFANKQISCNELKSRSTSCDEKTKACLSSDDGGLILQIWDTMGQEMFRSINKMYYRGVHGVVFVCDLFNLQSFKDLDTWLEEFLNQQDRTSEYRDFAYVLLANKCDIKDKEA